MMGIKRKIFYQSLRVDQKKLSPPVSLCLDSLSRCHIAHVLLSATGEWEHKKWQTYFKRLSPVSME